MSKNYRLQIPISEKNKQALDLRAEQEGFSSANDLVRLLVHKFLIGLIISQEGSPVKNQPEVESPEKGE